MSSLEHKSPKDFKSRAAKVVAVCALTLLSTGAANAQAPSAEAMERLRAMGIYKDMKTLPAWTVPDGVHRSDTVPSNFPIPVYKSNVTSTTFFNSTRGSASASLSITTKDKPDVVYQFYQSSLSRNGWKTQVPTPEALAKIAKTGQYFLITGTKDIQTFTMTIRSNPQVAGSAISVSWYISK